MSQNEEPIRSILWVDDEIEFLRAHIFFLEDHDWKVDTATNGHDALSMAQRENYDVVLLDEQMAGIDGLTTLQRLKRSNPSLFVVMVTKSEEERVMEEAIGRNIDGYLTKPVNPAQIVSLCKSLFIARSLRSNHLTTATCASTPRTRRASWGRSSRTTGSGSTSACASGTWIWGSLATKVSGKRTRASARRRNPSSCSTWRAGGTGGWGASASSRTSPGT